MKFLGQIILIAIGSFLIQQILPFYSVTIIGFIAGVMFSNRASFLAGALAVGGTWLVMVLLKPITIDPDLAGRVAKILGSEDREIVVYLTALVGALLGGFSTLAGSLVVPVKKKSPY